MKLGVFFTQQQSLQFWSFINSVLQFNLR